MVLLPGRYMIVNYPTACFLHLRNSDDQSRIITDTLGRNLDMKGEKWDVSQLADGRYTIRNVDFGRFAGWEIVWKHNYEIGHAIVGKPEPHIWIIKDSKLIQGTYRISPPTYRLDRYWGLQSSFPDLPLMMTEGKAGLKNWVFIPVHDNPPIRLIITRLRDQCDDEEFLSRVFEVPPLKHKLKHTLNSLSSNFFGSSSLRPHSWSKSDIVVLLVGESGVGKSRFIQLLTGKQDLNGRYVTSSEGTEEIAMFACNVPNRAGRKLVLVDTPGLDDCGNYNSSVFERIAVWLAAIAQEKVIPNAILLLHYINGYPLTEFHCKQLAMFRGFCGDHYLSNVIIVSTMWDDVDITTATKYVTALQESPIFWQPLIDQGAQVARFYNTRESALDIIDRIREDPPTALQVQSDFSASVPKRIARQLRGYHVQEYEEPLRDLYVMTQNATSDPEMLNEIIEETGRYWGEAREVRGVIRANRKQRRGSNVLDSFRQFFARVEQDRTYAPQNQPQEPASPTAMDPVVPDNVDGDAWGGSFSQDPLIAQWLELQSTTNAGPDINFPMNIPMNFSINDREMEVGAETSIPMNIEMEVGNADQKVSIPISIEKEGDERGTKISVPMNLEMERGGSTS